MELLATPCLFCEGTEGGLDSFFLSNVIGTLRIQIKPLEGKYGLADRIEGYKTNFKGQLLYIAIRDRDLDFEPPDDIQLIKLYPNKEIYTTYYSSIESYFVDADLIYKYWERFIGKPGYPSPLPIGEINHLIIEVAQSISAYQAVRWGLSFIRPLGQNIWRNLRSSWQRDDGDLPSDLSFNFCLQQAQDFFTEKFENPISLIKWQNVEEKANLYQNKFSTKNFYEQGKYLIWFHGKDLLHAVLRNLHEAKGFQIKKRDYLEWAAKNLDFKKYEDLQELRKKCETLIK